MSGSQQHFTFRWKIQPRPEGGFQAVSEDPADTLEGTTREEVEQKIKQKIAVALGPEIAAKLDFSAAANAGNMHVEKKFTFSLGSPVRRPDTPTALSPEFPPPTAAPIDAGGGSLLGALWKIAVLVGIAVIIWILLHQK